MRIAGYASTGDLDASRHRVLPTAYTKSIAERGFTGGGGIKLLHQHQNIVVGRIASLEVRNAGLWLVGDLWTDDIPEAYSLAGQIKASGGLNLSVGMFLEDADLGEDANGDPYLIISEVDLCEISIVVAPCNSSCQIVEFSGKTLPELATISQNLQKMKELLA